MARKPDTFGKLIADFDNAARELSYCCGQTSEPNVIVSIAAIRNRRADLLAKIENLYAAAYDNIKGRVT